MFINIIDVIDLYKVKGDKEIYFNQLLEYYDENGVIPDFTLTEGKP